jgi:hypothetical protein
METKKPLNRLTINKTNNTMTIEKYTLLREITIIDLKTGQPIFQAETQDIEPTEIPPITRAHKRKN